MRLTLRTLLAYLDDILEPAQAREIGDRVRETPFASALIDRIREVMRRRRLTAPDLEGAGMGLDPNLVAEYIDTTLPPDKVADVEKVCLESDLHLAEVAACHQITTLVQCEPVQISRASRERMYALGPAGPGTGVGTLPEPAVAAPAAAEPAAAPQTVPNDYRESFEDGIPEYLRSKPLWKRVFPYAVGAGIALVWVWLLIYGSPFKSKQPAGQQQAAADGGAAAGAPADETLGDLVAQNDQQKQAAAAKAAAAGQSAPQKQAAPRNELAPIDPMPPADEVEAGGSVVDNRPPQELVLPKPGATPAPATVADELADATRPAPPAEANVKPSDVVAAPPPSLDAPRMQYNSPTGLLLHFVPRDRDWMVLPPRALVQPGDRLVSPEPFEASVDVADGLYRATLMDGTSAVVLPPAQDARFGVELIQGRLKLEVRPAPGANAEGFQPVAVAVRVRDQVWRVELQSLDALCGLEVIPNEPDHLDAAPQPDAYRGGLYVVRGNVRFADGTGLVRDFSGPAWMSLTPSERADAVQARTSADSPLKVLPDWIDPNAGPQLSVARRFASVFEESIDVERRMSENLPPLVGDRRPPVSALAVKCLALMGSYRDLVEALSSDHEESREAAVVGLRRWLGMDPEQNGELLRAALAKHAAPDEVDILYRLLWGYTKADAADRIISEQLVGWLDHTNIAVRELAFYHIYRLTGQRYGYRPLMPPAQRRGPINRWRDHVARDGGLLKKP